LRKQTPQFLNHLLHPMKRRLHKRKKRKRKRKRKRKKRYHG